MCPGSKPEKSDTKNVQSRQCAWPRNGERFNPKMRFKRVGGVVGDLPHVSLTSKSLFGAQAVVASACVTKTKKQVRHAEQVFRGVAEGGWGHGWCKRVEGDMGHTRLKIGGQGGPVEHTGEKEVRVIPKGKEGKKTKKQK